MRLTTLNIRKRYLLAGCCMADYMTDHWNYIEEGNIEKAECVLTKSLKLDALRKTLLRWFPTISGAKTVTYTITYVSGTISTPFELEFARVNGIDVVSPFYVFSGTNYELAKRFSSEINGFISGDDDVIQVSSSTVNDDGTDFETFSLTYVYDEDLSPVVYADSGTFSGITVTTATTTEADYTYPRTCLTDSQMLLVIKKIDELCECEC